MKVFAALLVVTSFAAPAFAEMNSEDACTPVFAACAAKGYTKDDVAAPGKKIWLNCAEPILEEKKAVADVDVDPASWEANNCRDYRKAKDKFDADWAKKHKKPAAKK